MELLKVFVISGKQVGGFKSDDDDDSNNHSGSNDYDIDNNNSGSDDYDVNDNQDDTATSTTTVAGYA